MENKDFNELKNLKLIIKEIMEFCLENIDSDECVKIKHMIEKERDNK